MEVKTAFINHKEDLSIPEETALYLTKNKLAGMHYNELPVSTTESDFEEISDEVDGNVAESTFSSFTDYASEETVLGVRNNAHPDIKGGLMTGTVRSPRCDTNNSRKPLGLLVTLVDPDSPDEEHEDKYSRLRERTKDIGPAEFVLADIPLEEGAGSDQILDVAEDHADTPEEVVTFLRELAEAGPNDSFEAFGETFELDDACLDTIFVFQVLRLNCEDTHWAWYRDYPLFGSINHRGTTNGWNTGSDQLLAAYAGVDARDAVRDEEWLEREICDEDLIGADELETLCTAFLRRGLFSELERGEEHQIDMATYEEYTHTYPVGGNLQSVDIVAEDLETERRILSQVTFDSGASGKVRDLASAMDSDTDESETVDGWFFGNEAKEAVEEADTGGDRIEWVDVDEVLEVFRDEEGRTTLDAILDVDGNPSPPTVLEGSSYW